MCGSARTRILRIKRIRADWFITLPLYFLSRKERKVRKEMEGGNEASETSAVTL